MIQSKTRTILQRHRRRKRSPEHAYGFNENILHRRYRPRRDIPLLAASLRPGGMRKRRRDQENARAGKLAAEWILQQEITR